jgi:hypothetical protein
VDDGVDTVTGLDQDVEVADIGDDVRVGTGAAKPPMSPFAPVTSTRGRD